MKRVRLSSAVWLGVVLAAGLLVAPAAGRDGGLGYLGQVGGAVWAVAVEGSPAYVGEGPRPTVLDLSDQAAPMPDGVRGVAVGGGMAYVADLPGGLRLVDVSDPAQPVERGRVVTTREARDVAVADAYACGLRVVDVLDPDHPAEVGACDTVGCASGVAVDGVYAYVADGGQELRLVDVSDPAARSRWGSTTRRAEASG
jgi:hypothetical protein